jgi:hypothetical protein
MKNSKALIKDHVQNIIIVALCISAISLFCRAAFFDLGSISNGISSLFNGDNPSSGAVSVSDAQADAAQPLYVLVTAETGSHYAAKFGDERQSLLALFSATLGEALGSATELESVSETEFQNAARSAGVFLDYVYPQSLAFVAQGLGTACSDVLEDVVSRRIMLSLNGGSLYLYYTSGEGYYRCLTASVADSLAAKITECPIGMAQFAFELDDDNSNLDPYFIFTNESISVPSISASNPILDTSAGKDFLACFGINISTCVPYPDADGSTVYVDGEMSLRFGIDGSLIFTGSGSGGIALEQNGEEVSSISEVIKNCGKITKSIYSCFDIDTVIGVTAIDILGDGEYHVSLGQLVNGIPVSVSGDTGTADFYIADGRIIRIEMTLRSYESSSVGTSSPMPEKLTAAIVGVDGGEPVLVYADDGSASPSVSWTTIS